MQGHLPAKKAEHGAEVAADELFTGLRRALPPRMQELDVTRHVARVNRRVPGAKNDGCATAPYTRRWRAMQRIKNTKGLSALCVLATVAGAATWGEAAWAGEYPFTTENVVESDALYAEGQWADIDGDGDMGRGPQS